MNLFSKILKKKKITVSEVTSFSLGICLASAREAAGLSIEEAAKKTKLSKECLCAIESDFVGATKSIFQDLTYQRFSILRYSKMLGVPLLEVRSQLPPLASLNPTESTFLKNWNQRPVPSLSCWAKSSSRFYFPPHMAASLWRILLVSLLLLGLFYSWSMMRHLHRILFS